MRIKQKKKKKKKKKQKEFSRALSASYRRVVRRQVDVLATVAITAHVSKPDVETRIEQNERQIFGREIQHPGVR